MCPSNTHPPTHTHTHPPNPRTPPLLTHMSDITPAWCGPGRSIRRCLANVHQQRNTVHKKSQGFTHSSHCSAQSQTPPAHTNEAEAKRPDLYVADAQETKQTTDGRYTQQSTPCHCARIFDVNQPRKYPDCRLSLLTTLQGIGKACIGVSWHRMCDWHLAQYLHTCVPTLQPNTCRVDWRHWTHSSTRTHNITPTTKQAIPQRQTKGDTQRQLRTAHNTL
jgi:hypothetical protein